jgi:putative nucleotidyltransferase with HDIG domain
MTARVLRLANSAFYGFARRIGSITEAVILLGFKAIRGIVLAAAVSDIMNRNIDGYALPKGELWRHSQAVAIAARVIAKKVKFANMDLAFTAGLMHDIGKIILDQAMQESYQEVVDLVDQEEITFLEAENAILGFDHALIGGKVVEKWRFPPELVDAITYHHSPEGAENNKMLVSITHMADTICISMGIGMGLDGLLYKVSNEALLQLKMDELAIEEIIAELTDLYADLY